ncbi:MAG: hypothetical protein ABIH11_06705 [Candidatus Altiarchaeota archaeon]
MTVYSICGGKTCCPVVDVQDDLVKIGEDGNLCTLKKSEWDALKSGIKSGLIQ